jgi:hypothetical protein
VEHQTRVCQGGELDSKCSGMQPRNTSTECGVVCWQHDVMRYVSNMMLLRWRTAQAVCWCSASVGRGMCPKVGTPPVHLLFERFATIRMGFTVLLQPLRLFLLLLQAG